MTIRIEVERLSKDFLSGERWIFRFFDDYAKLKLREYYSFSRPSKRHKFRIEKRWDCLDHTNDTLTDVEVPLPDDVATEALTRFKAQITIGM